MTTLKQDYDTLSKMGMITKDIPSYIVDNINPAFILREYQKEAIFRFTHYLDLNPNRSRPSQLLFHMATGSGKTLLMASNILHLYNKGYRNFVFFVNSTNIIDKTRENFLNSESKKYLFNEKIKFEDKEVKINEVSNFEATNDEDINIVFTTIQGLHSLMNSHRENSITYEDFKDKNIVIISDEAHHINSWTKNNLGKDEELAKTTWEHTVNNIFNSNTENIMLEYTATVDLDNPAISQKYSDKIIYEYSLKQFRQEGYSKEVKVLQADLSNIERALQAIVLSQYRRKIAEKNKLLLKPVILFKSRTIADSKKFQTEFVTKIDSLLVKDLESLKKSSKGTIIEKAFDYFDKQNISTSNLITELKEDFSEQKCLSVNSQEESEDSQLLVNSLEDHNNEIRCIFAVDKLNEGWDVLNLFDIVRLYDTRDSKGLKPGKTTLAEAQLIGRGARYFPFVLNEEQDRYKRKYDQELENDLKVIEELYYHSSHNPRYIQELTIALRDTGMLPPKEPKIIDVNVKEDIKKTDFWKNGFLFINKKLTSNRSNIKDLSDLDLTKIHSMELKGGFSAESSVFSEEKEKSNERMTKQILISSFNDAIIRRALCRLEFYKYNNLLKYFPKLDSLKTFIESIKNFKVDVRSSQNILENLGPEEKLEICIDLLDKLENDIKSGYTEYKGSKKFYQLKIKEIVDDKKLRINIGDYSDQEYGVAMSETNKENLRLNLSDKEWYVYNENYGTSEEKHFIQFINGVMSKLQEIYSEIFLLRNENLFKIFRFSDGRATEPDFVLFLKKNQDSKLIQYQIFVEPKGTHLLLTDKWKEDFLKDIEGNYNLEILAENENYRLIGMPFYNENMKSEFIDEFNSKFNIE